MWAARPHLASIFEKLLDQKTFICLRLGNCSRHGKTAYFHELFHVKHCSWESNLPSILEDALPFCLFGTFPHTVGNHPPPPN